MTRTRSSAGSARRDQSGIGYLRGSDRRAAQESDPPSVAVGAVQHVSGPLLGDGEVTRDQHTRTVKAQDVLGRQHHLPGVQDARS